MHRANHTVNVLESLKQLASDEELDLMSILLSDKEVSVAVMENNRTMLKRVFGICIATYEDSLLDTWSVNITNYAGHFQINQLRNSLLVTEDDLFGTVGCAIVQLLMDRDNTGLTSSYCAGKRVREDMDDLVARLDVDGISNMLPQIEQMFECTKKAVKRVQVAAIGIPAAKPSDCDKEGLNRWRNYLSAVVSLYTQLRTNPGPVVIEDKRMGKKEKCCTVGQFIRDRLDYRGLTFVPKDKGAFSDAEKQLLAMVDIPDLVLVADEDLEYFKVVVTDVFTYIGDSYHKLPELPVWKDYQVAAAIADTPTPSTSSPGPKSPVHQGKPMAGLGGGKADSRVAEGILRDFYKKNLNKTGEVLDQLLEGGLSSEARTRWSEFSKGARNALLKPLKRGEPLWFRDAVTKLAQEHGYENDEVFAENVASRLVVSKSAFKVDARDGSFVVTRN